jgi:phage shock protein A
MASSKSDLAAVDQRFAIAREHLERQHETIRQLKASGHDTTSAEALFKALRRRVESVEARRRAIEDELFANDNCPIRRISS